MILVHSIKIYQYSETWKKKEVKGIKEYALADQQGFIPEMPRIMFSLQHARKQHPIRGSIKRHHSET